MMKKDISFAAIAALAASSAALFSACDDDCEDFTPIIGQEVDLDALKTEDIPSYADDYSSISSWDNHLSWNLANVHDPSVVYYNGVYYMWGTDASYGNAHEGHGHFQGKMSKDLVNWTWCPGIFFDDNRPAWILNKINEYLTDAGQEAVTDAQLDLGYWAPCARVVDGKIRVYYSIVINSPSLAGNQGVPALIGMAETTNPYWGQWEDKGFITSSASDKSLEDITNKSLSQCGGYYYYNGIDPSYIVTPEGEHWLIHGSWHSGIAALQLNPSTGLPLNEVGKPWCGSEENLFATHGINIYSRKAGNRWQASEGPEVIYHDGYYYLFLAYDGLAFPYNTRVVRSEKITGPYVDMLGTNGTEGKGDSYPIVTHPYAFSGHPGWVGISHCCVFPAKGDANANEWYFMSQARLQADAYGNANANAIMMGHVRRLVWAPVSSSDLTNRWPIALPERYAAVPNASVSQADLVGTWEHINLKYTTTNSVAESVNPDQSTELTLNENGSTSGALNTTWSFDAQNQLLIIGNAALCVSRELDWEASPRQATIVYAGIGTDGKTTWWGKKK